VRFLKNNYLIAGILLIVGLGLGFFGGMKYQQTKVFSGRQFPANRTNRMMGQMFRPVTGQIINQDDKSITVKLQDGSSKIVLLPGDETVSKTDAGSKADLKTGINVAVFGTENSDGSLTAQNIQINPMFRMGRGSPSPSPK